MQLRDAWKPCHWQRLLHSPQTAAGNASNKWEREGGVAAAGTWQGRELPNLGVERLSTNLVSWLGVPSTEKCILVLSVTFKLGNL